MSETTRSGRSGAGHGNVGMTPPSRGFFERALSLNAPRRDGQQQSTLRTCTIKTHTEYHVAFDFHLRRVRMVEAYGMFVYKAVWNGTAAFHPNPFKFPLI